MTDKDAGATDDIRAMARRLATELNPTKNPGGMSATTLLVMAWIDEINADWDERHKQATGEMRQVMDLAIALAKTYHGDGRADSVTHREITPAHAGPLAVYRVPTAGDLPMLRLGGARPLWTHYLSLAHLTLELLKNSPQ